MRQDRRRRVARRSVAGAREIGHAARVHAREPVHEDRAEEHVGLVVGYARHARVDVARAAARVGRTARARVQSAVGEARGRVALLLPLELLARALEDPTVS